MNNNKALIVVDCQNDFFTGSLSNANATKIIPNIVNKIQEYKKCCVNLFRDEIL